MPPCSWNKNHLACVNTWAFLRGLGQLKPSFSKSGQLKMSELAFGGGTGSSVSRNLAAKEIAVQLDRIFRKALLAKYEKGYNFASGVAAMTAVMSVGSKTLCQLSEIVDAVYNFRGEVR